MISPGHLVVTPRLNSEGWDAIQSGLRLPTPLKAAKYPTFDPKLHFCLAARESVLIALYMRRRRRSL